MSRLLWSKPKRVWELSGKFATFFLGNPRSSKTWRVWWPCTSISSLTDQYFFDSVWSANARLISQRRRATGGERSVLHGRASSGLSHAMRAGQGWSTCHTRGETLRFMLDRLWCLHSFLFSFIWSSAWMKPCFALTRWLACTPMCTSALHGVCLCPTIRPVPISLAPARIYSSFSQIQLEAMMRDQPAKPPQSVKMNVDRGRPR